MTDSRTDTASAPEQFTNPARTDTELISPSRVPAEQGAGSREQEKNLSDSTIHPTTSTSTRTPGTVDGTTRPCATLTAQHATAMLDQLEADREQSRYWQDRWATDHGDHHIDAWLTSLADWLPEERAETPTEDRPVASVVARDDDEIRSATWPAIIELRALDDASGSALAWPVMQAIADLCSERGQLVADRVRLQATVDGLIAALGSLRITPPADGPSELERTEGDLAVAVREANHHRGLVAKVAALHVAEPTDPFWCQACQTSSWPCPTATALSVPVPS